MTTMVLDTNVVSYLMKGGPLAEAYQARVRGNTLVISFMTFAEMHEGAYRAGWGAQKLVKLEAVLRSYVVIPSSSRRMPVLGKDPSAASKPADLRRRRLDRSDRARLRCGPRHT